MGGYKRKSQISDFKLLINAKCILGQNSKILYGAIYFQKEFARG